MPNRDAFSSYHPVINFMYFALVLVFSMFFMHPVSLLISLAGAIAYHLYLNGRKALRFQLLFLLPMALMAALINPAFNHEGATLLAYLPSGNPLTLESIAYGFAAAAMLAAVVLWFSCYGGDDLRQVCLSLWPGHPGPQPGAEHDAAVRAQV